MKTKAIEIMCLMILCLLTFTSFVESRADYTEMWKKVNASMEKGLPETAEKQLGKIVVAAKKEKNQPQLLKTILFRKRLFALHDNPEKDFIDYAESQWGLLDAAASAILHAEIAKTYSDYQAQNGWRLVDNLPIDGDMAAVDMKYWDRLSFQRAIDAHYVAAMQDVPVLKATETMDYLAVFDEDELDGVGMSKRLIYEETLFEYLSHRVANYYVSVAKTSNKSVAGNTGLWWLEDVDFAKVSLGDGDTPDLKALRVFQELMAFNLSQKNENALIYNDVKRYDLVNDILGDDSLYQERLHGLIDRHADNALSAEIAASLAQHWVKDYSESDSTTFGNYVKAWDLCKQSIEKFPKSKGAASCQMIVDYIENQEVRLNIQPTQLPDQPIAAVLRYRNVSRPYYKIVKVTEGKLMEYMDMHKEALFDELTKSKAFAEGELQLPFETDFCEHSSVIAFPELPVGQYYILIKTDKNIQDDDKMLQKHIQVSCLGYVAHKEENGATLYVVDRKTSDPKTDVVVELYNRRYDYKKREYKNVLFKSYQTDKSGKVHVTGEGISDYSSYFVNLRNGDDVLLSERQLDVSRYYEDETTRCVTTLFADRAIYRPGQTVSFKGVVVRESHDDKVLAEHVEEKIVFKDANWQEIASQSFVTDEYGAFNGSFVIPTSLLNGSYTLNGKYGRLSIRVEEYKRPTFEVHFEKVQETYRLKEDVTLQGSVEAYAGFNIDKAQCTYRVVRKTNFPWRFWWWNYPNVEDEQIAFGETRTNENGKFAITFNLKPSAIAKPQQQPVFTFEVEVTATSAQGETHSSTYYIKAGYNAIGLSTNVPNAGDVEKSQLSQYVIEAVNMNGQAAKSKVSRKFYRYADNGKIDFLENIGCEFISLDRQVLGDEELDAKFPQLDFYARTNRMKNKVLVYEDVVDVNGKTGLFPDAFEGQPGRYFVVLESLDDPLASNAVEFALFDKRSEKMPCTSLAWVRADKTKVQPGETITFYLGSSAEDVNFWVQVCSGDKVCIDKWVKVNKGLTKLHYKVKEKDRGVLYCQAIAVKEGIAVDRNVSVSVPYDNLHLDVTLSTVRDVLRPGAKEQWDVTVRDYQKNPVASSVIAGMYDASLDVFAVNHWRFSMTPSFRSADSFTHDGGYRLDFASSNSRSYYIGSLIDEHLPSDRPFYSFVRFYGAGNCYRSSKQMAIDLCVENEMAVCEDEDTGAEPMFCASDDAQATEDRGQQKDTGMETQDGAVPTLRENFNETAFFFPNLRTNADGSTTFSFTMPDALTRWKLMLLAYDKNRKTGYNSYSFKSSKPVMIMADMPRYMYDTDTLWFVANVINTGDEAVTPKAKLEIFDAATMLPIDLVVSDEMVSMDEILPGRSHEVRWKVAARHDLGLLAFRFTAYADAFSDAEQHLLPVLSSEVFMTQTMPVTVKANIEKTFDFECVANPDSHERDYSLTLNFSANPVWYAVQALPYLAEQSTQRAETAFYVFYANALSAYIANQIPNLKNYIQKWQIETPDALQSQLEKDPDLKAIMLQETPWVLDAKNETEQRNRIANLFEINTLSQRQKDALTLIRNKQVSSGGWSWWDGMPESPMISTYILGGFGKLQSMGVIETLGMAERQTVESICQKAVRYLESEVARSFREMRRQKKNWAIGYTTLSELYALSFFKEQNADRDFAEAKKYYLGSLEKNWTSFNYGERSKAALVLYRNGRKTVAQQIIQSLKETARKDEAIGMYWPKAAFSFESQLTVHADIMSAFAEIDADMDMDPMRVWLLTQKQTCAWGNAASTAEAVYALLMRGSDWLRDEQNVTLSFGNQVIDQSDAVAGTGFIQRRWNAHEVTEDMRHLTVNNPTNHLVWGGLFRQYFVPIDEVQRNESAFKINRELFVETVTETGKVLIPVGKRTLQVGDKLVVKITFENTQDMTHVFVKDLRAAGFEPVEQISRYKFGDAMCYYQTSSDTDMEFFIEFLPKGIHQVEYDMYVTKEGKLSNGYALIQCLYAPEFSAYSDGMRVKVGDRD